MIETPRTDALAAKLEGIEIDFRAHEHVRALVNHARNLEREAVILQVEREKARARADKTTELLVAIHNLLLPPDTVVSDGKRFVFDPQDKSLYWDCYKALGNRIRAIPDELAKIPD